VTVSSGVLQFLNILVLVTGVAYAVLAAQRNRLCWIAGAVSSACAAVLSGLNELPMQAALQVFYLGMSAYGWWSWTRHSSQGELDVSLWPHSRHLAAAAVIIALSFGSAFALRQGTAAAWPLLDSLTTFFSLLATWLAARGKLENWLYWVVINTATIYLFAVQRMWGMAVLSALLTVIAVAGHISWRRRFRDQQVQIGAGVPA
jgi:nicotinamide mononucleotide transporter